MPKSNFEKLFFNIFGVDISNNHYRKFNTEKNFRKKVLKLQGKEVYAVLNKMLEILKTPDLNHYKNLQHDLKKYKRVHVNTCYVILFYDEKNKTIYFIDYEHHDKVYKK